MAKILALALAFGLYKAYEITSVDEQTIAVPLTILINEGFVISSNYPEKVRITIRGKKNSLTGLADENFEAVIDLRRHLKEGKFREPIQLNRRDATDVGKYEVILDRRELTVTLEEKMTKSVVVSPSLTGFPSAGYELSHYFVSPSSVTVSGPKSLVTQVNSVKTEEIDLAGRSSDFTVSTRLLRPSTVLRIPGGEAVEFHAVIKPSVVVEKLQDVTIVVADLVPGLALLSPLPPASLTAQGLQLDFSALEPGAISFMLDCSEIKAPGTWTLPLGITVPDNILVLDYEPREITITVGYPADRQEGENPP
jgi:YbbR domain-containing protein